MSGSHHTEEGLLLRQRGGLILQRDNGPRWRLHTDIDVEALIDTRVKVEGILNDAGQLEVVRLVPA